MKQRRELRLTACLVCVALLLSAPVFGEPTERQLAIELIDQGIAHLAEVGETQAFRDFSDRSGDFVDGPLYIFIVDFDGVTLAHGGNPALVGMNMSELKDPDGVFFIREFIELARTLGVGWVDYKWSNPETKRVEGKTSLIRRYGTQDYFLGCGIYKED